MSSLSAFVAATAVGRRAASSGVAVGVSAVAWAVPAVSHNAGIA